MQIAATLYPGGPVPRRRTAAAEEVEGALTAGRRPPQTPAPPRLRASALRLAPVGVTGSFPFGAPSSGAHRAKPSRAGASLGRGLSRVGRGSAARSARHDYSRL